MYSLPRDMSGGDPREGAGSDAKRGKGSSAIFVARNRFAVLDVANAVSNINIYSILHNSLILAN